MKAAATAGATSSRPEASGIADHPAPLGSAFGGRWRVQINHSRSTIPGVRAGHQLEDVSMPSANGPALTHRPTLGSRG